MNPTQTQLNTNRFRSRWTSPNLATGYIPNSNINKAAISTSIFIYLFWVKKRDSLKGRKTNNTEPTTEQNLTAYHSILAVLVDDGLTY